LNTTEAIRTLQDSLKENGNLQLVNVDGDILSFSFEPAGGELEFPEDVLIVDILDD
jgi:hypothetical protein